MTSAGRPRSPLYAPPYGREADAPDAAIVRDAMRLRHHAAMEVVAEVPLDARYDLLAYVVWPDHELAAATEELARARRR
jgi:hypothetical protein